MPHRVHTEWQRPLSGVHSIMMEKLAQVEEGVEYEAFSLAKKPEMINRIRRVREMKLNALLQGP